MRLDCIGMNQIQLIIYFIYLDMIEICLSFKSFSGELSCELGLGRLSGTFFKDSMVVSITSPR